MKIGARLRYLRTAITGRTPDGRGGSWSRFAGAVQNRIVQNWFAWLEDPNRELVGTLADLRARAREAVRDNGEAAGLLLDFEADIVGAIGAQLQYRARRPRGAEITTLNDRVERAWWEWCRPGMCTVGASMSFAALQRLLIRTVITDGEFLARKVIDPRLPHGFALQPIDPDQLDETENRGAYGDTKAVVLGVEVDGTGKPTRYAIWDRHPSLSGRTKQWIPANEIVHAFKRVRVGQLRGIPWFAPALVTWKLGSRYTEAELYQSLLAAAQGGFFVNKDGTAASPEPPKDANGKAIPLELEVIPGMGRQLPNGLEWQAWEPKHPTANYVGFMKAIKRTVARAFGRSYASVTGDLSDVNFSSMRIDREREKAQNRMHQQDILIEQFCDVVFADWFAMAALTGALGVVTQAARDVAYATTWLCTGWPWIDPVKDATAALMELNMGVTSPQRICAEKQRDFYGIVDEIAEARAYCLLKGVPMEAVPLAITVQTGADSDTPSDKNATDSTGGRVLPMLKGAA